MKPSTQIRPVLVIIAAAVAVAAFGPTAAVSTGASRMGAAPPAAAAAAMEWGLVQDLGEPHEVNWFGRVVFDSAGTAIAVWVQGAWDDRSAVMSTRPPGGVWSEPEGIPGTRGASELTLAIDATDDLVLAWTHGRRVLAQRQPAGGDWTTPVVVQRTPRGRLGTYARYLQLAVSPGGRAVLAWQPYDDDADSTSALCARAKRGGHRTSQRKLEPGCHPLRRTRCELAAAGGCRTGRDCPCLLAAVGPSVRPGLDGDEHTRQRVERPSTTVAA